jgi:hypothetical protein
MNIYLDGIIPNTPPKYSAAEVKENLKEWRSHYTEYLQEHPGEKVPLAAMVAENDRDLERLLLHKGFYKDLDDLVNAIDIAFSYVSSKYNQGSVDFEDGIDRDDSGRLFARVSCNANVEMVEPGEPSSWDYPGSDPVYDISDFFIDTHKDELEKHVMHSLADVGIWDVLVDISYEIDQKSFDRAVMDAIQEEYENDEYDR